ncbi:hypothetical protein JHK87_027509 [Glycine soja]|nr:hypothetical protein JHK87_027509 [Glycine soja]
MTGPAVNHSGRMDLQQIEALGANYAGGNNHLITLICGAEEYESFNEVDRSIMDYPSHEVDLDEEDLDIPWSELILKENIGTAVTARIQIWWKRDLVPEEVRSGVDLEGMGLVWFCVSRMKIRDEEIWC